MRNAAQVYLIKLSKINKLETEITNEEDVSESRHVRIGSSSNN